jgi:hypothetical protein
MMIAFALDAQRTENKSARELIYRRSFGGSTRF